MKKTIEFLKSTTAPIWWNIVSAIIGAVFVVLVIPFFNKGFENSKIRTSFVLTKMNQLDGTTNRLAILANRYAQTCIADASSDTTAIGDQFQEARFDLDLLSVEIIGMLARDSDRQQVSLLQKAATEIAVRNACPQQTFLNQYIEQATDFKAQGLRVSQVLANSADL